jgi:hypothetical protein
MPSSEDTAAAPPGILYGSDYPIEVLDERGHATSDDHYATSCGTALALLSPPRANANCKVVPAET